MAKKRPEIQWNPALAHAHKALAAIKSILAKLMRSMPCTGAILNIWGAFRLLAGATWAAASAVQIIKNR